MVAIITMFFLFAMIAFVTNLAAPLGTIWKNHYSWAGMLGNMMNFLAYLFMGIPAGNLLTKIGYKKTALLAMVIGIVGLISAVNQGKTSVASIGIVAKKPEQFGKAMLFPAMVETYAILALLVSILAVNSIPV